MLFLAFHPLQDFPLLAQEYFFISFSIFLIAYTSNPRHEKLKVQDGDLGITFTFQ